MSNLLLGEAVISKLKSNSALVTALGKDPDQYIGQKLRNIKDRLPYVSVEIRPSYPVIPVLASPRTTYIRITTYSADELLAMHLMDVIEQSIVDETPYWDISTADINNNYSAYLFRQTLDEDFNKFTDVFMDILEMQITWRIACDATPAIDIETCPDSSDARDPDISC